MKKSLPLIGGHVAAAGGLANAITNGEAIGATVIQLFGSSPRQWAVRLPKPAEAELFKKTQAASGIKEVYLHAPYIVNIASSNPYMAKTSVQALAGHMQIAEFIGAKGVIFHVGSGKAEDKSAALKQSAEAIKQILSLSPGKAWIIIENAAGEGAKVGATFEEIAFLIKHAKSPRVKACYDTAHGFEAGVIEEYSPKNVTKLFDDWDKIIGLEYLVALHVNDSKTAAGSHHDRHENIGKGHIGLAGFTNLAKDKRTHKLAWILEVPGFDEEGPDKQNVDILKSLF